MNNYNSLSMSQAATLPFFSVIVAKRHHQDACTTSKKEGWRHRWQTQPVNQESQEQKWRRQGKLK